MQFRNSPAAMDSEDRNHDGQISREEFGGPRDRALGDKDGMASLAVEGTLGILTLW